MMNYDFISYRNKSIISLSKLLTIGVSGNNEVKFFFVSGQSVSWTFGEKIERDRVFKWLQETVAKMPGEDEPEIFIIEKHSDFFND